MMKLRKLIRNKERSSAKVLIKKFNMQNNEWSISKEVIFEIQDKASAEGGFRMAFKEKSDDESFSGNTWLVKKYNASSKETFKKMGKTCEMQSRKAVQMNCLARYFSVSFSKAVLEICEDFCECFNYKPVYFGKINHKCVTVEEFLTGDFQKYINNNSSIFLNDLVITEKAKIFVHYTYEKSNNRLMLQISKVLGVNFAIRKLQLKP